MADFKLGQQVLLGGSVGVVQMVGTTYRHGVPVPVVGVTCPDYQASMIKLVDYQIDRLGPVE